MQEGGCTVAFWSSIKAIFAPFTRKKAQSEDSDELGGYCIPAPQDGGVGSIPEAAVTYIETEQQAQPEMPQQVTVQEQPNTVPPQAIPDESLDITSVNVNATETVPRMSPLALHSEQFDTTPDLKVPCVVLE